MRRPVCRKCVKAKRTCAGYDRDLIFVNRTPSSSSVNATSVLAERRALRQLKDAASPGNPASEADLQYLFSESRHNCSAFRKYAVRLLEATYLPKQPVSTSEGSFSWAYRLADLLKPSKALDTSIFAFCLSQLHVTGAGSASLYQCLDQYNTALRYLYADLDDPKKLSQEETLAAIIVLSTCELYVCPVSTGWSVHAHGIAEVLRLRDPETTNTPAWRHLFSRMRLVCTIEALTKREAQILRNDIWRQIVAESKLSGPLDEVFNMTGEIPGLLERAVALVSITGQDDLLRESAAVALSLLALAKSFDMWLDECWKATTALRVWSIPSRVVNPADVDPSNRIFPFSFEFESLVVAVPVIMCWGTAAQLYSNVIQIHDLVEARLGRRITLQSLLSGADTDAAGRLEASSQSTPPLTGDEGRSIQDIRDEGAKMARNVCQSLEYLHRIEMGTYGGHATTYPAWSARQYFRLHQGYEREASWLQNMHKMEGPGTRWGLALMTFTNIDEPLAGFCEDKTRSKTE
ncbi:tRNA dimethylallyltransferase, mitochondrial [Hypoxylon texense]